MTRSAWVVLALLTAALAIPAAGVAKSTGGTLTLGAGTKLAIAWESS